MPSLLEMKDKVNFVQKQLEKTAMPGYISNIKKQIVEFSRIQFNDQAQKQSKKQCKQDDNFLRHVKNDYVEEIR